MIKKTITVTDSVGTHNNLSMRKQLTVIITVLTASLLVLSCSQSDYPAQTQSPGAGFSALFNGKDMSGWNLGVDQEESSWSVVDGIIHCKGEPRNP